MVQNKVPALGNASRESESKVNEQFEEIALPTDRAEEEAEKLLEYVNFAEREKRKAEEARLKM